MRNLILFTILIVSSRLFSIEFNIYEMVKEHEFNASYRGKSDEQDLAVEYGTQGIGPRGPEIYFSNNSLIISDQLNNRTIIAGDNYSFLSIQDKCFFEDLVSVQFGHEVGVNYYGVSIRKNGAFISVVRSPNINFMETVKSTLYYKDHLFVHDKNNDLWCIKEPRMDMNKNKSNIIDEEDTIKLITGGELEGLTIDSKKRLFVYGELKTLDSRTFVNYYREIRDDSIKPETQKEFTEDYFTENNAEYIGTDKTLNSYWYYNKGLLIINSDGWPIMVFTVTTPDDIDTYPAVSPEGDVYFMKHGKDKVTLYKIERQW